MDVRLPNGTVIKGVPDDYSQEDVQDLALQNNLAYRVDFPDMKEPLSTPVSLDDPSSEHGLGFDPTIKEGSMVGVGLSHEDKPNNDAQTLINSPVGNVLQGFNELTADILGAPADLGNWINKQVGLSTTDNVTGGSESIKDLYRHLGIGVDAEEGMGKFIGKEVMANVLPTGAALNAVRTGAKMVGPISKFFKPVVAYTAKAPLASSLQALGISALSGAGGYSGGEMAEGEFGSAWKPTGQIVGSLVSSLAPTGAVSAVKAGAKGVRNIRAKGVDEREAAVAKLLQENMMPSSEASLDSLDTSINPSTFGNASTGQVLDDPKLMALQRAMENANTSNVQRAKDVRTGQRQSIKDGLNKFNDNATPEDISKIDEVLDTRIATVVRAVEERTGKAIANAKAAVERVKTTLGVEEVGQQTRKHLDAAYRFAKKQEQKLWQSVGGGKLDVTGVKNRATNILRDVLKSDDPNSIPRVLYEIAAYDESLVTVLPKTVEGLAGTKATTVKKLLQQNLWNDQESIKEVTRLRSRIQQDIRDAKDAGNNLKVSRLSELLGSLFDDIAPATFGGEEAMLRVDKARKFSKSMHEIFTDGPIGQVMGYKGNDLRVPAEQTMDKLLQPSQGKRGYQALLKMVEKSENGIPKVNAKVSEWLKAQFNAFTLNHETMVLDPAKAKGFLKKHESLLEEFPALREEFTQVGKTGTVAKAVQKRELNLTNRIKGETDAAKFTNGSPGVQLDAALDAKDPLKAVNKLIKEANKDPSGKALRGLKGSFFETMTKRIASTAKNTEGDMMEDIPSPEKLIRFVRTQSKVIKRLYGQAGLDLMLDVVKGASVSARTPKGAGSGPLSAEVHGVGRGLAGSIGVLIGTRIAKVLGGNELMIAAMGRKLGERQFTERMINSSRDELMVLLEDALYNPELARRLIIKANSMTPKDLVGLNRWAAFQQLGLTGDETDE